MEVHEASLSSDLQGSIVKPAEQTGWGVVVLAGSSGRVEVARARLFAGLGAVCLALRWFGGEGQPPGICEVQTMYPRRRFRSRKLERESSLLRVVTTRCGHRTCSPNQ
jgi:dienelactone hydrolase